jgi:hypothetical protein
VSEEDVRLLRVRDLVRTFAEVYGVGPADEARVRQTILGGLHPDALVAPSDADLGF